MAEKRSLMGGSETRIWQSADIEVVGNSQESIVSEIRARASTLFEKFTIREIKYRWAGSHTDGGHVWVGQATVMENDN